MNNSCKTSIIIIILFRPVGPLQKAVIPYTVQVSSNSNTKLHKDFLTLWQIKQLEVYIVLLQPDVPLREKNVTRFARRDLCKYISYTSKYDTF
jgi:hypothetical protein